MSNYQLETKAIRIRNKASRREHTSAIYLSSSFTFDSADQAKGLFDGSIDGTIYSRFTNPNTDEFITKMAALEGTETGVTTSSGMAAIFSTFAAHLQAGDHLIATRALFGSSNQIIEKILTKWNISHTYIDSESELESALEKNTRLIFVESPSNPGLKIFDLEKIGQFAKENELIYVVDNTFATPFLQQPIEFGADLIIHSATKYLDGQGRAVGGIVLGSEELIEAIFLFNRQTGPSLSPFNSWLFCKSLETLQLRIDRHSQSAQQIAEKLVHHPKLSKVSYPFLNSHPDLKLAKKQMSAGGGIICIELKGAYESARRFLDRLKLISHTANLGDSRTICTHPASTTHSKLSDEARLAVGIPESLIRISVGLENVVDIFADLEQALD